MALPATYDFTGTGAMSGDWTREITALGGAVARSSDVGLGSGSFSMYYWNADSFDNDQYAEIKSKDTNHAKGPAVRVGSSDGYYFRHSPGASTSARIIQYNGGSYDVVASTNRSESDESVYKLEVEGTGTDNLKAYEDDVEILKGTDASITSGSGGLAAHGSSSPTMDDWEGGDLAAGGEAVTKDGTITPAGAYSRHFAGNRTLSGNL